MLAQLFGQLVIDALRGSNKTIAPPSQGVTNVSLGAASAVFGSLSLLFGLLTALIAIADGRSSGTSIAAIVIVATVGFACSCVGFSFGRMAPQTACRHPGMAKYGVVVSPLGMILSVVPLVVTVVRIFL